jgi:hypothetical protein
VVCDRVDHDGAGSADDHGVDEGDQAGDGQEELPAARMWLAPRRRWAAAVPRTIVKYGSSCGATFT